MAAQRYRETKRGGLAAAPPIQPSAAEVD